MRMKRGCPEVQSSAFSETLFENVSVSSGRSQSQLQTRICCKKMRKTLTALSKSKQTGQGLTGRIRRTLSFPSGLRLQGRTRTTLPLLSGTVCVQRNHRTQYIIRLFEHIQALL
ncbi:uncharacterized protein isoform X3 [Danio rerio]|uniref:Uncharacterized protein isoform X3 n=2 Tax=Danio rerio TaxID=7955 RepID=A0AC58JWJ5_DANRE